MGLLDWNDNAAEDDFALPDYGMGFGFPVSGRPGSSGQSTDTSSTRDNHSSDLLEKVISNGSSMGSENSSSSYDPMTASTPRPATTPTTTTISSESRHSKTQHRRHTTSSSNPPMKASSSSLSTSNKTRRRRRRRSSAAALPRPHAKRAISFDLYHEDEELQEAEPRITFCDICKRPCEVH